MIDMGSGYFFDTEMHEILKNRKVILNIKGIKGIIFETLLKEGRDSYLTKEKLIESAWGKSSLIVGENSLTQQVYLLRKSLNSIGFYNYILSHSNAGYKISKRQLQDFTSV
jgi:DNA-binding winged helix-turn-helix (wHTH) protein